MVVINQDGQLVEDSIVEDVQARVLSPLGGRALFPDQGTEISLLADGTVTLTAAQLRAQVERALGRSSLYAVEDVSTEIVGDTLTIRVVLERNT